LLWWHLQSEAVALSPTSVTPSTIAFGSNRSPLRQRLDCQRRCDRCVCVRT